MENHVEGIGFWGYSKETFRCRYHWTEVWEGVIVTGSFKILAWSRRGFLVDFTKEEEKIDFFWKRLILCKFFPMFLRFYISCKSSSHWSAEKRLVATAESGVP